MSSFLIAGIAFLSIFTATVAGFLIQRHLPEHHLSTDTKDSVKFGVGLVMTLTALILGLLVSSTKGTFDDLITQMNSSSADYVSLGLILHEYGSEADPVAGKLVTSVRDKIEQLQTPVKGGSGWNYCIPKEVGEMADTIMAFKPTDQMHSQLQSQALNHLNDLVHDRWIVETTAGRFVPPAVYVIAMIWVTFLAFIYALFAPRNIMVFVILTFCALSVSGAFFLIDEMSNPFDGIIRIKSAPLDMARQTVSELQHQPPFQSPSKTEPLQHWRPPTAR